MEKIEQLLDLSSVASTIEIETKKNQNILFDTTQQAFATKHLFYVAYCHCIYCYKSFPKLTINIYQPW